jgi:hypothetical protein
MTGSVAFQLDPALPLGWLVALGLVCGACVVLYALTRGRALLSRALLLAAGLAALAGPSVVRETRQPVPSVAVVLVDRSASMALAGRTAGTAAALAALEARLRQEPGLDLRITEVRGGADGTRFAEALDQALSGVPSERVAGAFLVTDGRMVDAGSLARQFPLHQVLVGAPAERDRRLTLVAAPRTGTVGDVVSISVRIDDPAARGQTVPLVLHTGDGSPQEAQVQEGQVVQIDVPVVRRGAIPFALETPFVLGEISAVNNALALSVTGVRDRLRVLLVTGEPYAGLRAWRNLLKADPSVDLVQFTILRSDANVDFTPDSELSLIAFPTRELFVEKIQEFDLVIFDRFRQLDVLPDAYLDNIARWVEQGGAFLMLAGPGESQGQGIAGTPLGRVLPAMPGGQPVDEPFRPVITPEGADHPVTAPLVSQADSWGRWLRVQASEPRGTVLMRGAGNQPLLVLGQVGEGRAAAVMSDTAWLWQRGYEGGGPFDEMFRRTAHWLMKEPDLETDRLALLAAADGLRVERRASGEVEPVTVTGPDGAARTVALSSTGRGRFAGTLAPVAPGLHEARSGALAAFAVAGTAIPAEARDLTATRAVLEAITRRAGGGEAAFVGRDGRGSSAGLALRQAEASQTVALRQEPLVPAWALALLLAALGLLAWWREGR